MNLLYPANDPRPDPFDCLPCPIGIMALIPHLCNYIVLFGQVLQISHLMDSFGHGFFHINMFLCFDGIRSHNGMQMIRCSNQQGINGRLFVDHFPKVRINLCFGVTLEHPCRIGRIHIT